MAKTKSRSTPDDDLTKRHRLHVADTLVVSIKPNPQNPRVNDHAVDAVVRSIEAFGFNNPIITDEKGVIIAGHTRYKAALVLNLKTVPVIMLRGRSKLTRAQKIGYAIADNKTAEIADWDDDLLTKLVAELNQEEDFDLGALGFDDNELTRLLMAEMKEEDVVADDAPALPAKAKTKLGDLYVLGDHRLLCGNAGNPDAYTLLTSDQKMDCLFTDPPYGVGYESRGKKQSEWGPIANDDLDAGSLETFLQDVLTNVVAVCRPGAAGYVCHTDSVPGVRIAAERAFSTAGFRLASTIIWVKQVASMGWQDYRSRHEPLLYGFIAGPRRKLKDRTQTTVWQIDREGNYRHPTQKPVALVSRALRNSTIRGEAVLDPFMGSGTTLIACEMLGRRCFGMELEPKYCDVVVQRWEEYTGLKAERISVSRETKTALIRVAGKCKTIEVPNSQHGGT